jgi:hypothetical protein
MVVVLIRKIAYEWFLSILLFGVWKKNFLSCPVHPALLHNFGCCYIILMRHKQNQDKNEQFNITSNQIKKFYLKSVHFITIQHKLSRAFQTDRLTINAVNLKIFW